MKKILILAFLILSISCVNAISVSNHTLDVSIGKDGEASILEIYDLRFLAGEFNEFKEKKDSELGVSLLAWKAEYRWFFPHFAETTEISGKAQISFDESTSALFLDYSVREPLAEIDKETPRAQFWKIKDSFWKNFQQERAVVVPEDVEIIIRLPSSSELLTEGLPPQAKVEGSTVTLSGISTNNITIEYKLVKPLASAAGLQNIITETNIMTAIAILLLASLVLYWKREPISQKVEDYVVEHSEIDPKFSAEDIDIEA